MTTPCPARWPPGDPCERCGQADCRGSWRALGFRKRDEIFYRVAHWIDFKLHPAWHRTDCTCKGSGRWT